VDREIFTGIYITGDITQWGQIVGKPEITDEIHVYTRSDAAGAPETWAKYLGKTQEDLLGETATFAGARLSWLYSNQLTGNTAYTNELVVDQNLDDTQDFRADMVNSLQVAMSSNLALKVSLQWLYDNMPSLTEASDPDGLLTPGQIALVELEKLDTIFTVSLVVNF